MMAQRAGCEPAVDSTNAWRVGLGSSAWQSPRADERMITLVYRVARELGYSRRSSGKLCQWIMLNASTGGRTEAAGQVDAARPTRAGLIAEIRTAVGSHTDPARLQRALDAAVLADELSLLPPRQQAAVRWAVEERWTVVQIAQRTGWKPQQVAALLRAGLRTLTRHAVGAESLRRGAHSAGAARA